MITIKCKSKVAEQLLMNELKYNKSLEIEIVEAFIPVLEAKEYEDSAEFTDDMTTIEAEIIKIKKIIVSPQWGAWMKITDQNYDTNCVESTRKTVKDFMAFADSYAKLVAEIEKAE
jgi:hypothetical protein